MKMACKVLKAFLQKRVSPGAGYIAGSFGV
jgi:hypothetical protein